MTTTTADDLLAAMPFAASIGVRLDAVGRDRVVGHLDHHPDRCTAGGVLHGGALMSLADTVGAVAAYLHLPEGATGTATVESKTNLLSAVTGGRAVATARPVHVGGRLVVVQTEVRVDDRLVALTTQTQAVLRPPTS